MKAKTKEKIIAGVSLTMVIVGVLFLVGSVDTYSNTMISTIEFIIRLLISGSVIAIGGVVLKWILIVMIYHHKHGYPRTISRKMRKRIKRYEKYRGVA